MNIANHSSVAARGLLGLLLVAMVGAPLRAITVDTASKAATQESVSAAVATPLKSAQEAIAKKKWNAALNEIDKAKSADNKTPRDMYAIDTLLAYILYRQDKFADAAPVYERLLASNLMPADEKPSRMKAVAEMYFRKGDFAKAVRWSKEYLDTPSGEQDVESWAVLGDAQYRLKEYKNAAATVRKAIAMEERANKKPSEAWLRIVSNACFETNDDPCLIESLKKLIAHYGKQADWNALLTRKVRNVDDRRVLFGYRRLMIDLGVLKNAEDYEAAVFAALNADLPVEAQQMLQSGKEILTGPSALPGHYERLLKSVDEKVAASRVEVDRLELAARNSPGGQDDVLLGRKYLGEGDYDRAIVALKRGLKEGHLDDVGAATISLGTAYLKEGKVNLAAQTFESVPHQSKWHDLAELWALRAGKQSTS